MARRLFVILAVFTVASAAAYGAHPRLNARVNGGEVCWDPDIEFPIP